MGKSHRLIDKLVIIGDMGILAELSHVDLDFEVYTNKIFTKATKYKWLEGHLVAWKKLY